jgi:hypothetical protein
VNSAEPEEDRMIVSAGYPQRQLIYFPVDSLMQYTDRLIAHAEFRLFADPEDPLTMNTGVGGLLFRTGSITNDDWVNDPDSIAAVTLRFVGTELEALDREEILLKLDVTGIVSGWLAGVETNGGLQLEISSEDQTIARQIFHNHLTEDESNRPQLHIWYVEPSN